MYQMQKSSETMPSTMLAIARPDDLEAPGVE
jgi:hypothetical protein